jgi:hypothetical protein
LCGEGDFTTEFTEDAENAEGDREERGKRRESHAKTRRRKEREGSREGRKESWERGRRNSYPYVEGMNSLVQGYAVASSRTRENR